MLRSFYLFLSFVIITVRIIFVRKCKKSTALNKRLFFKGAWFGLGGIVFRKIEII